MAVAERSRYLQLLRTTFVVVAVACAALSAQPTPSLATLLTSAANIPFSGISPGGVDMATGEIIIVCRPDIYLDGPFPLVFRRYYASMLAREGLASGHLGPNWLGTYDWTLAVVGTNATLVTNEGAAIRFTQGPGGGWNLTSPTYAKFKLDLVGGAWRFTNPVDRHIYFFDGTTWLLTSIHDEHGNALTLTYGSGGALAQVADGLGRVINFIDGDPDQPIQITDGTRTVSYSYTGGTLTGVTDAGGHSWSYSYAPGPIAGLLTGITEPLGNTRVTQTFDPSGRVMSQTDGMGGPVNYQYDTPSGNIFTDPMGSPWTYQHDSMGRLTTLTNPIGGPHSYMYDALGRLQSASRPLGDATSFQYDPASGYPSDLQFADGSAAHWTYSSHLVAGATLFDLSTASFPDGASESYTRDANGNVTDLMDRGGFHWMGTYNPRGQLLTLLNPTSGMTTLTYDAQGRLSSHQDNAGNVTGFGYDGFGRMTQITWPDLTHRNFAYNALDALTGVTDERSKLWSYGYDVNGRLVSETDPLMEATGFGYDPMDRVNQITDPLGHAAHYAYDPTGRLMSVTDRSGRTTSYQYNSRNLLTGIQDPAGGTDGFGYDADGRMLTEQDPLGHSSTFMYDFLDRLTHLTDRVGTGFTLGYDAMGRLTSSTGPLGYNHTFGYDSRGLLTSAHNATSETDFLRTPLGEISRVVDPNRNEWPRTYDPQGRITTSADPLSRSTSYQYDALSRVIHVGRPDGSVQQVQYDPAGRITGQSFTGGTTLTYGYDDANRMTSATGASFAYDAAGRMINSNGFALTYDQDGRPQSETFVPGKAATYSYDSRGLLSQVTDWMSGITSFSYDTARRLTGMGRPNATHVTYQYDGAGRLTSAVESNPGPSQISSISITRDALGRPMSISRRQPLMPGQTMPATSSFTYDAASQLNGSTHDALGRMTSDASRSFQWDGASRLVHFAAGVDSPRYTLDAFGRVTGWTSGSQSVAQAANYAWLHPDYDDTYYNPINRLILNVREPSGLLLYGMDASSGARTYYHYDEAGNTAYLTNDGGSVTAEYAYGPFGGMADVGQTANNPFTFGAAGGRMQLGQGSSGLWTDGPQVYDDHTMRVISGLTTSSGPGGKAPGPAGSPGSWGEWSWMERGPGPVGSSGSWGEWSWMERGPGPTGSPGSLVELNPQPFPPGTLVGRAPGPNGDPAASVELNPQPFPPGTLVGRNPGPGGDPAALVELNPQPFPPGSMVGKQPGPPGDPGSSVALNPQPFPPDPCASFNALLRLVPVKPSEDFGMLKTDGNAIGGGEFGGGYDYSHGSRLMQEEGIYYFFDHAEGGHKLGSPGSDLTELTFGGACVTMIGAHSYGGGGGTGKVHVHEITMLSADPFDDAWQLSNIPKNGFDSRGASACAWCP